MKNKLGKNIRLLFASQVVLLFLQGCNSLSTTTGPLPNQTFGSILDLSPSSLASLTDQDPRQVFELALSRTLSGNGVRIREADRTDQLICENGTYWLVQDFGDSISFERQKNGQSELFGLIREGESWRLSTPLTKTMLTEQDLSRYLNATDWLRLQLKTFLFPGQPDLLFDIPESWSRDGETLVCTSDNSVFRFSLSEAGTLASEEVEGSGESADRSMTFEPLQVSKTGLQRLDQLFSIAADAKAGHKVTLP
jgi:hypothetical protein